MSNTRSKRTRQNRFFHYLSPFAGNRKRKLAGALTNMGLKNKKKFNQNSKTPVRFVFSLLAIVVSIMIFLYVFEIKNIVCKSQFTICNPAVTDNLSDMGGQNVINTYKRVKNLLENEIVINGYSLHLNLKGELVVYVNERVSKYCVSNMEKSFRFDNEYLVLKASDELDPLCFVNKESSYTVGEELRDLDKYIHAISYKLSTLSDIGQIVYEGNFLTVEYHGGIKLIFPLDGDSRILAGRVYYVVSQFDKIKNELSKDGINKITEVDFRYKNPVIRFI